MINETLRKVKDIKSNPCVSIILNTHRTHPDNKKDGITLKNLVTEAENRLLDEFDKRSIVPILEKIHDLASRIDHYINLDSMAIFVNESMAEVVRMPISVENRVIIDTTFATRDLVRAMHQSEHYYVLCVSHSKARLIEAYNDKVVREYTGVFPMENSHYTTNKEEKTTEKTDHLVREFFNIVDKQLQLIYKANPLPVVLAAEERNQSHYREVADKKKMYIASIHKTRDNDKAHEIVTDAWVEVSRVLAENQASAVNDLEQAQQQNKAISDVTEIYRFAKEGRADTLFVEKDFFQPALVNGENVQLVDNAKVPGVVDDIIDETIEFVLANGGNVVFLPSGALSKYQKMGLKVRY
ncbi:MAG: hypothetical protein ACK4K0_10775 [Flavobacteriales bacterium]